MSEDEVKNSNAPFSVRCREGELEAYVGRFVGDISGRLIEEGQVTAKVFRSDGTFVKNFQYVEALKAYKNVTKSMTAVNVGRVPAEYRFRLEDFAAS